MGEWFRPHSSPERLQERLMLSKSLVSHSHVGSCQCEIFRNKIGTFQGDGVPHIKGAVWCLIRSSTMKKLGRFIWEYYILSPTPTISVANTQQQHQDSLFKWSNLLIIKVVQLFWIRSPSHDTTIKASTTITQLSSVVPGGSWNYPCRAALK